MAQEYRFVTTWTFTAPVERVWAEVGDPMNWKSFWFGLEDVRPLSPDSGPGVGARYELVFKSFLPYSLTMSARIDEYDDCHMVIRTTGELEGTATFDVEETPAGTRTRLLWTTRTTKAWMNALAFLLRDLFSWNHDFLMRRAGRGLAERIGADVELGEGTETSLPRALLPLALAALAIGAILRRRRG